MSCSDKLDQMKKYYNLDYQVYTKMDNETFQIQTVIFGVRCEKANKHVLLDLYRCVHKMFTRRHGSHVKIYVYLFDTVLRKIGEIKFFKDTNIYLLQLDRNDDGDEYIKCSKIGYDVEKQGVEYYCITNFFSEGEYMTNPK